MNNIKKTNLNNYNDILIHYKNILYSEKFEQFSNILNNASQRKKKIFFFGNGGSASNANHATTDLNNYFRKKGKNRFRSISLSSNIANITAIGNDYGYKNIFKYQLEDLANKEDVLIIFSVSGSSENILEAAKFSKKNGIKVISITGFSGGKVKKYSHLSIDFDCKNYGMVEDLQMMLVHTFSEGCQKKYLRS